MTSEGIFIGAFGIVLLVLIYDHIRITLANNKAELDDWNNTLMHRELSLKIQALEKKTGYFLKAEQDTIEILKLNDKTLDLLIKRLDDKE